MPSNPSIAIIITCWNYESYVVRAIRSVTSQPEAAHCEVLVIDDGSTDGSWAAIKSENVRAYRINNGGQLRACLFGVDRTTAPFILFLDADDRLAPGSLAIILALLDKDVSKLQFPLFRINQDDQIINNPSPNLACFRGSDEIRERILSTGVYVSPPTSGNIFRRDVCEHLRQVDYENTVDGIILLIAPFMGDVVSVSSPLGYYRIHGLNLSGLGSKLDPTVLHRDMIRFVNRLEHLRRILDHTWPPERFVAPERTVYYLQQLFYLDVAEGRNLGFNLMRDLIWRVWADTYDFPKKLAFTIFLIGILALPKRIAKKLVELRINSSLGRRIRLPRLSPQRTQ